MTMNSNCGCGCTDNSCDSSIAELPRYYPRQLITPDDLTLEQDYFRYRLRRHNRLMHGWGVVCGALVCPVPSPAGSNPPPFVPWQVQVQTGYILGPYGDEIILDCARTVDLRTGGVSGVTGDPCVEPVDPWCSQVFTPPTTSTLYIAVKYKQCMTRPVRVQPVGCGCSDTSCEYSRWHDGYEIGVLTQCPPCTDNPDTGKLKSWEALMSGDVPACPDCSCGPWVGLASVTVNPDGSIKQIDNCSCRRLVVSFSRFSWNCEGSAPTVSGFNPTTLNADGTDQQVVVSGANFRCGVSANFGPNTSIKQVALTDSETLQATVNIASGAKSDATNVVTATNIDGTSGVSAAPIVFPAAAPAPKPPKAPTPKKPAKTGPDS